MCLFSSSLFPPNPQPSELADAFLLDKEGDIENRECNKHIFLKNLALILVERVRNKLKRLKHVNRIKMSQSTPSSVSKIQSYVSSNIDTLRKLKTYLDLALASKEDENLSKVEHVLKSLEDLLCSNIDSDWHNIREEFFDLLDLCLQTILKIFDIDRSVFNRMCFKWLCLIKVSQDL
ncbi:unnamed protein product [Timema podura]|uniref:Uncharacterized protein n=1 Tax=Timema podura TaxID=61482 RepID=A0ABN7P9S5_TIMPD|nr:unnamed protein product [Timema podura]